MTRSHKQNDRDHAGLADGTADESQHLPRYFAKHGHVDSDPKKVKKEGGGKGNWYVIILLHSRDSFRQFPTSMGPVTDLCDLGALPVTSLKTTATILPTLVVAPTRALIAII